MACNPPVIVVGSLLTISEPFVLSIVEGGGQGVVLTTFTLPAGTIYNAHVISSGSFDSGLLEWTTALVPGSPVTASLTVEVTDLALFTASDRRVVGVTTPVSGEVVIVNNTTFKCLEGYTALELLPCQSPITPILTIIEDLIVDPQIHATILVDSSGGDVDVTIDPADLFLADCGTYTINVKAIDISNDINIVAASGVIIDFTDVAGGVASLPILNIGESKAVQSDGVNLYIV